jgi:deoxyhypusine synthase
MKCLGDTYLGEFSLQDTTLRSCALNRTSKLILPNNQYVKLYDWLVPIPDQMVVEQDAAGHSSPY